MTPSITPPLVLALDIGTSSIRCLAFDCNANQLKAVEARRTLTVRSGLDGASEMDPEQLVTLTAELIDEVVEQTGALASEIEAITVSTFVGNLLGLDENGRPLTPVITYADTRSEPQALELKQNLDEYEVHQRTGCRIHSSYSPARLCYLREKQPEIYSQVRYWISLGEYLELQFLGDCGASYSVAAWSGLLNRRELSWDREWLQYLELNPEMLAPLVGPDQPQRGLRPQYAARWPVLADVTWYPALGDGAAANLGAGCVDSSWAAATVGTTSAVRVVLPSPVETVPDGLFCYQVDRSRSLLGGAMSEGGNLFAWLQGILKLPQGQELDQALLAKPAASHGLHMLPFLAGERAPGWKGGVRGVLAGLNLATGPLDILQAGMEAIALRIALVHELLCGSLDTPPGVRASGNALTLSPIWPQILADALGQPVELPEAGEATARGAALLTLEQMGHIELSQSAPPAQHTFEPRQENLAVYQEARLEQMELYRRLFATDPPFGEW